MARIVTKKKAIPRAGIKVTVETQVWSKAELNLRGARDMNEDEKNEEYFRRVTSISTNRFGSIIATAKCGDMAFVCAKEDIPKLAEFFNKLVAAQNEAKSAKK